MVTLFGHFGKETHAFGRTKAMTAKGVFKRSLLVPRNAKRFCFPTVVLASSFMNPFPHFSLALAPSSAGKFGVFFVPRFDELDYVPSVILQRLIGSYGEAR